MSAIDFTSVEVWTKHGLVTFYLLFVIELKSRKVHFAGCTPGPDQAWMVQTAKNLTDCIAPVLPEKTILLMDRDGKFCPAFRKILENEKVQPLLLPPRSPDLNSYCERFMRSIKSECLDRMIFFGENSLRNAVKNYLAHYHTERNHQSLDNRIIEAEESVGQSTGSIECRKRLSGMLKYYERSAA